MELQEPKPGIGRLFRIWASVGLQSFGGGASTTFLIQRSFIERHKWMTMEEFAHLWNLCILTPGINLVALTVLIGRKLGGVKGIAASLIGLLVPSALITCLLAAIFQQIEHIPAVQEVVRGVIPATGAVMLLVGLNFAKPLFQNAYKEGWLSLAGSAIFILLCALAIIIFKVSVIFVVIGAALIGALLFSSKAAPSPLKEEQAVNKGGQQ